MVPPWLVREDVPLHMLNRSDVVLCRYFSEAGMERLRWTMLGKFRRLMAMCRWIRYMESGGIFVGLFT